MKTKTDPAIVVSNAMLDVGKLLQHLPYDNHRTMVALAHGALSHAHEYLVTGTIKLRRGLYTAILNADHK